MEKLYFSDEIARKLAGMHQSGLVMLEAPAGYGKTTAVRWALKETPVEALHWFTAVSFLQDAGLDWLIRQIGQLDPAAGTALRQLGFLNRSNVSTAADILMNLRVEEACYLIFDNFQLIGDNWPAALLQALADRRRDGLHVILISQNFGKLRTVFENASGVCAFTARDFLLTRRDIAAYGRQLGLELTRQQQEMLLRLSVFDLVGGETLQAVLGEQAAAGESLLARCPLMHHDQGNCYPHELLRHFLERQLDAGAPEFRAAVYDTAGEVYHRAGREKEAVSCFFQAGSDEKLLSCDLTGLLGEQFHGWSLQGLATAVLARCPEEVLSRHPLSLLRLCLALFAGADFDGFSRQMPRSRAMLEKNGDEHMLGEWYMVAAFLAFPDLKGMRESFLEAEKHLQGRSQLFVPREPFLFGTTSMWYLFYRTPGKMLETADDLRDMLEVYNRLTGGHGAGACELYLGEAYSVQGKFDESDIYAHKAAMRSEQTQNATVTYGAALLLGINAIYQSDMIALQQAIEYLENKALAYPFLQHTAINTLMAETVRGYLLGLMMEPDRSAGWARGDADMLGDLTFTNFMAKTNRITDLILHKAYKRAIASVEASLQLDPRLISLSTRNFMCVGLALCYLAIGQPMRAADWLDQSLTIAEQDQNYTFLACFRQYLSVLFLLPSIKKKHEKAIREIKALKIQYTKAEESRIFAMLEKHPEEMDELTDREREVAVLAAAGLRNKEIAQKLCISEETVKSHIRSIFAKTNINRRSHLVGLLK